MMLCVANKPFIKKLTTENTTRVKRDMLSIILVLVVLAVPLTSCLPMHAGPKESNKTLHVSKKGSGECILLNGMKIKAGEWKVVENCTLKCSCQKSKGVEVLTCDDWCNVKLKVCREGDVLSQTKYYEFVGKTGCRRCETEACDALIPENRNSSIEVSSSVNKTHRFQGMYEILEETIMVFKKPKEQSKISD